MVDFGYRRGALLSFLQYFSGRAAARIDLGGSFCGERWVLDPFGSAELVQCPGVPTAH